MIKTYRKVPRFENGFNGNPYYQAVMEQYQADPYVQQMNTRFPEQMGIPMTGEYNPYLDPRNYETYGDDYVPENLKNEEEEAVLPRQVRANIRSATSPVRKPTTAAQDKKAAKKRYDSDMRAAEKKSQKEIAEAKKQVAQANTTLKRNGQKTYSLGNITSKTHQLPNVVITGRRRRKVESVKDSSRTSNVSSNRVVKNSGVGSYRSSRVLTEQEKKGTPGGLISALFNWLASRRPSGKNNTKKKNTINGIRYNRPVLR